MSATDARLARIAAVTGRPEPQAETRIYKLDKGISIWFWLCEPCLGKKLAKGWALMEKRNPPHALECDECRFDRIKGRK